MPASCTKRRIAYAAVGVVLAFPHSAAAADDRGQFGVRGAALISCAIFERERQARSDVYHVVGGWIDGYVTGVNQHAPDTYDAASFESTELVTALISEHCKKHPETPVFAALNALAKRFSENRLRSPSKKIEIVDGERKVLLYEEVVRRIHERLASGGFYKGKVSATYGAQVREAMRAYQRSIGLQPTGFPDQLTLWRLFYPEKK